MTAGIAPKVLESDENIESITNVSKINLYTKGNRKTQAFNIGAEVSLRTFFAIPAVM
jgi:hypothetical protein